MQHVKKTRETPHSLLLKAASIWSNRSSKVSMFIATKFMNRIPVESGQLTSYLRQDVEWLEGSTGNSQEPCILISLQTISFLSQTLIERMDQCAFLLNIFLSWGFFLLPRKRGRTLGTRLYWWIIRDLTIRQRTKPMKMSLKNWLHVLWIFFRRYTKSASYLMAGTEERDLRPRSERDSSLSPCISRSQVN